MPINSFLYPGAKFTPAYEVANSLRFNDGSSDNLVRTNASATNNTKYTLSAWVKRTTLGTNQSLLYNWYDGSSHAYIFFATDDKLAIYDQLSGTDNINMKTTAVFRDVSAWYNIVVKVDTTESTQANRVRVFINGVEDSIGTRSTQPGSSASLGMKTNSLSNYMAISSFVNNSSTYLDGYIAEAVYIDGQALDATSFGEFDSDTPTVWKPIDVTGLTFGNNGFYLDFENASSLGADVSGNSNNFTVNNLTSVDQSTDTCTNNFATLNPLAGTTAITFSEGNLKAVFAAQSSRDICQSGFGVSNGKWYWEVKGNNSYGRAGGITAKGHDTESNNVGGSSFSYGYYGDNGTIYNNNSNSGLPTYATYASNTIGVYLDLDNNKLYFSKDGSLQSTTGISITDPASLGDNFYFPAVSNGESGQGPTFEFNFGSPAYSISSGNTDDNGYGNFEYSPNITGDGSAKSFYALNSRNLAEFG